MRSGNSVASAPSRPRSRPAKRARRAVSPTPARLPAAATGAGAGAPQRASLLRDIDRLCHARMGELAGGISLVGLAEAFADWCWHLAIAPGKQLGLLEKAFGKWQRLAAAGLAVAAGREGMCIEPLPQDRRFQGRAWREPPFSMMYQSFLLTQQWWHNATSAVPGVGRHEQQVVEFCSRQLLDMVSPSNFPWTNPEVIERTVREGGRNLLRGYGYFLDDLSRLASEAGPAGSEAFRIGENIAATPGSVVFENRLIELIQYRPTTATCRREPVLIVPAWIMKYYILDLSPESSLVRCLVENGHTVFCISWKNPDASDRDLGMDDYRSLGVMAAIDAVEAVTGSGRLHSVGYCLGGTLLMIAAAAMARDGDDRLASMSLLAAQADFTEAGELSLFVNESQLSLIEDMMWKEGYLDQRRMTGAFQLLRSRDLVWSRIVREYLMGDRRPMNALMAWNADSTRMPYRMHAEYLRNLFLNNDLAENRLLAGGKPVFLDTIKVPVLAVATERDHVAPWRSVAKLLHLLEADFDFILASGGHNTGIVAPPGEAKARHKHLPHTQRRLSPDEQLAQREWRDGSWWPVWMQWLAERNGEFGACPPIGNPDAGYRAIRPAPGKFVLMD